MRKLLVFLFLLIFSNLQAQEPQKLNSSEIFQEIKKLNFLGRALYVAAHPDDENTRLISYLSNELHAKTAYLSLTRGDGGQNLIGPELREKLGIIRTQELLAARKIDGGEQFFTRANDFGYSKNPEETLEVWNEEEIMKDVVMTIRKFRPDVIINRFNVESAGRTHGHHTSSAILSTRAFEISGNKNTYPELAEKHGSWQPKKLFFNTSPWFYSSQEAFEAADKSNFLEVDTGVYYPLTGKSNTEIASLSRSQHQSQGFGSTGTRGKQPEYLEFIAGEHPKNENSLFAGINTTWSRVKGGKKIGEILKEVEENYDFKDPSASIPGLLKAYTHIQNLDDGFWEKEKSDHIKEIIAACAGLYLEAVATKPLATPGEEIEVNLEAINRSASDISISEITVTPNLETLSLQAALPNNESWRKSVRVKIPEASEYSGPYWLVEKSDLGIYKVKDQALIGLPETPRKYQAQFNIQINGTVIPFSKDIVYKENDPVKGEKYRPFEIVPPVSLSLKDDVLIFANHAPKQIPVTIKAMKDSVSGVLKVKKLDSWNIEPVSYSFGPLSEGEEVSFSFEVSAPDFQNVGELQPIAEVNGKDYTKEIVHLDYEHIPFQTLILPSETKLVKINIEKKGDLIGYIQGAGDVVPEALEQIGYRVEEINPLNISAENLAKYDAVVLGIRAYNTVDALTYKQPELLNYVENGGNLIVQYNTSRGINTDQLAPYKLSVSRDRVTDENSAVRFLDKDHPVLNIPNKISQKDFDGWVQERGLYFPDAWAPEFTAVLSMNDEGETPKNGSLLIAPYGKGHYVYTGLSFFREFPAGVPGAFRLFANLLSLGKEKENQN